MAEGGDGVAEQVLGAVVFDQLELLFGDADSQEFEGLAKKGFGDQRPENDLTFLFCVLILKNEKKSIKFLNSNYKL